MQWYHEGRSAFEWLLGRNHLGQLLYVPHTGGCRDGLHPNAVNQNQGAESTLAYLISSVEIQHFESMMEITNPIERRSKAITETTLEVVELPQREAVK